MKRIGLLLLGLMSICGCGAPTGDLEGQVLFKDKPMAMGTVTIIGSDNVAHQSAIETGAYTLKGLPVGEAKIMVVGPDQLPHPDWTKDAEPHVRRPDRDKKVEKPAPTPAAQKQPLKHIYATQATTPLTVTIKAGKNQHEIKVD